MEKHKKIDTKAIKYHIAGILKALGDDPEREGLKDTPERVAKMYEEVFEGMNYTNEEIAEMFNKTFALDKHADKECASGGGASDMVVVKDIDIFSYCEHHLALMYDMKVTVAYIPKDCSCRKESEAILLILSRWLQGQMMLRCLLKAVIAV